VFKNLSLAVVALVLFAGSAMADDSLDIAGLDLGSIQDVDNAVVEANLDVDFDKLGQTGNEEAVEACFRRFGGWGGCGYRNYGCYGGYGCYNYCYQPCYYTYQPVFYYRPVCYTPCYTLSYWGCY
jgi:hypothetical protein